MNFLERVKEKLIIKNTSAKKTLSDEIANCSVVFIGASDAINEYKEQIDALEMEISDNKLDEKEENKYNCLKNIKKFKENYYKIVALTEEMKKTYESLKNTKKELIIKNDKLATKRKRLYVKLAMEQEIASSLSNLNEKIEEIINSKILEEEKKTKDKKKDNFIKRLFKGKKQEENNKEEIDLFKKYENLVKDFIFYYGQFNVRSKLPFTLNEEEVIFRDIEKIEIGVIFGTFNKNIENILEIVKDFNNKSSEYKTFYKENPNNFNLNYINEFILVNEEKFKKLEELRILLNDVKYLYTKQKELKYNTEVKVKELIAKEKVLAEKEKNILKAKSIEELKFKDKEDAESKLKFKTKNYVIVPINKKLDNISQIFSRNKKIEIEYKGEKYLSQYNVQNVRGRINSIINISNTKTILMIPIESIKFEDIYEVNDGKIYLNPSVIKRKEIVVYTDSENKKIFKKEEMVVNTVEQKKLENEVKKFMDKDYSEIGEDISYYQIFKEASKKEISQDSLKREAVLKWFFENKKEKINLKNDVVVDGKYMYFTKEEIDKTYSNPKILSFDLNLVNSSAQKIKSMLEKGSYKTGFDLEENYGILLKEYLRCNKEVKADYYREKDTHVSINGKRLMIKPKLPENDEKIVNVYTRSKEDRAYKMMKLAQLVNKLAHSNEIEVDNKNSKTRKLLMDVKDSLINEVIDISDNNPDIDVSVVKDHNDYSVRMKIPGYGLIAVHAVVRNNELTKKLESRVTEENQKHNIMDTSIINIPGVNIELLTELKKMKPRERVGFICSLDEFDFFKLFIRMGYDVEDIRSEKERRDFIEKVISEEKLDELIKEQKELYKDDEDEEER